MSGPSLWGFGMADGDVASFETEAGTNNLFNGMTLHLRRSLSKSGREKKRRATRNFSNQLYNTKIGPKWRLLSEMTISDLS